MKRYITLFVAVFMFALTVGCANTNEPLADKNAANNNTEQQEETKATIEPENIIYESDETIQQFLAKHNKIYPDSEITTDMVSKKYHHGSEHDDQVNISNWAGVTISSTFVGMGDGIQVFIENVGNRSTNDELKDVFEHYIRVYDEGITPEKIDEYWNQIAAIEYTKLIDIDEFEFNVSNGINALSYISIESTVK